MESGRSTSSKVTPSSEAPFAPPARRVRRVARRVAFAAICLLSLTLRDTGARPPTTLVPPTFAGPTVELTLVAGSSEPIRVVVELHSADHDGPLARHEGLLPVVLAAPRGVPLRLRIEAPGRARYQRSFTLDADRTLRVAFDPGLRLSGQTVDERGEPVGGARIRITQGTDPAGSWVVRADASGAFTIDTLGAGEYRVEASAGGHASTAREGIAAGAEPLRLVLERVGLVAGRVVRPDGRAASDATVVIAGSGLWPARQTEADADGSFRIAELPPGVYEVRAFEGDLVASPRRGLEVEPGVPAYLTFALTEGAALRGVVRDASSGKAISGAEITISAEALDIAPRAVTSNAEGRFTVRGLIDGPRLVSVFAEGYVPVSAREQPIGQTLELALEPAATLVGVVLDQDHQPVVGASIEVIGESATRQPVALGPDAGFRASVFASQLAPSALPPNPGALEVVSGTVPPIPLAPTEMVGMAPIPPSPAELERSASFLTDEEGRFRVTGIPPGHVQVIARRVGHASGATARLYVSAGGVRDDIELILAPAGRVHGRVEDGRGMAVEGVLVEVRSDREPVPRITVTDAGGEFEVDDVVGELTLTATSQGRPAVRRTLTVAPSETAELTLTLEGELHALDGRVVDEAGFGVSSAQLVLMSLRADAPFRRTFFSAEDGTFTLTELPAPPWRLEASGPTFAPTRIDLAEVEQDLRVVLARGADLVGTILDDMSGEPVAARARLTREGLPPRVHETQVDADGAFRFARLPPGRWNLSIESEGHLAVERTLTLRGGEDEELDAIRLAPAGWLEGTVVDALGEPLSRATVWLDGDEDGPRAQTDVRGEFVLRGAAPGMVAVRASHPAAGQGMSAARRVLAGRETLGVVVHLSERFDPERAEALPGRRRGVAVEVESRGGGVRVRRVVAGSRADGAGLLPGDVLERIDGAEPGSAREATALLRGASGLPAVLQIRRGDERATVLVERESWLP